MSDIDPNDQREVNTAVPVLDDRTALLSKAVRGIINQLTVMRDEGRLHPADYAAFESILMTLEF